jgi:predicted lipopolysaccharide heptosyltransferase III
MDRESLIERNLQLADAFHKQPMQHRLRQRFISTIASIQFSPSLTRVQRVLFIRPDHIGDMLLATPAIRALKEFRPYTEIHVLAGPWSAPILNNISEIDQVLTVRFPGFDRQNSKRNPITPYLQLVKVSRQLRYVGYTSAVIMRPDHWWGATLAYMAGIRERIGYDLTDVAPFLTRKIPFVPDHVIRQNMQLIEHWTGKLEDGKVPFYLDVEELDKDDIQDVLAKHGISHQQDIVCIHPGAGTWVKQWEATKWAQVAEALTQQTDVVIVFTGTSNDRPMIQQIQSACSQKTISLAGNLPLEQLAALYQRAKLVIGCDSGPMHIASAVQTPTVSLFGAADPQEFSQWGDKRKHSIIHANIGCRPCRVLDWGDDDPAYHPCMREIGIGEVLETARRLLNQE